MQQDAARPLGYHLVNNLIHAVNALLVYWFVLLTFQTPAMSNSGLSRKFIAFASAFVFVSHPIQTQAVTYIAQRFTSYGDFFLSAFPDYVCEVKSYDYREDGKEQSQDITQ